MGEENSRREIDIGQFVEFAQSFLGTPYRFGVEIFWEDGKKPKEVDCSELIELIYNHFKIQMPDGAYAQYKHCLPLEMGERVSPGDLGFYGHRADIASWNPHGINHIGCLISKAEILEARGEPHNKVIITYREIWERHENFLEYRKVPGVTFVWPNGRPVRWESV